jgi:DHA2 family multidrug resistance protein
MFGVLRYVEDPPHVKREMKTAPRFDYLGVGFITLALGCMEVGTDRGENYDWLGSGFIRVMFILSAAGFLFGCAYLLYVRDPIVNLRVFKDRNFALGSLLIAMMGFVLYASAVLIPQLTQQQLGYTATWAGLVLAPGAVVLALLIPATGKLLNYVPTKYVIAAGGLALGSALIYSSVLTPDLDFTRLALLRATQTAALALLFVPISTIAYATLPEELNGDAAALFSMARNVFGGIGISISTALINDHLQTRQARLIDHLTPVDQPYNVLLQQVEQGLVNAGQSMAQAVQSAPGIVFQLLKSQAAILAYSDVFLIAAGLSFVMIPTALLLSGIKTKAGAGAG